MAETERDKLNDTIEELEKCKESNSLCAKDLKIVCKEIRKLTRKRDELDDEIDELKETTCGRLLVTRVS